MTINKTLTVVFVVLSKYVCIHVRMFVKKTSEKIGLAQLNKKQDKYRH